MCSLEFGEKRKINVKNENKNAHTENKVEMSFYLLKHRIWQNFSAVFNYRIHCFFLDFLDFNPESLWYGIKQKFLVWLEPPLKSQLNMTDMLVTTIDRIFYKSSVLLFCSTERFCQWRSHAQWMVSWLPRLVDGSVHSLFLSLSHSATHAVSVCLAVLHMRRCVCVRACWWMVCMCLCMGALVMFSVTSEWVCMCMWACMANDCLGVLYVCALCFGPKAPSIGRKYYQIHWIYTFEWVRPFSKHLI